MGGNYTLEEYLKLDEQSESRLEYWQGEVLAMSGGTLNHARIGKNIARFLSEALEQKGKECEVFSADARLFIREIESVVYPDSMVVCGEVNTDEGQEYVTNPVVVLEVLSKSTEGYDRGEKFFRYQAIPTLKEYVLVDQYQKRVEVFRRMPEGGWLLNSFFSEDESVTLSSLKVSLPFSKLYQKVKF